MTPENRKRTARARESERRVDDPPQKRDRAILRIARPVNDMMEDFVGWISL